MIVKLLIDEHHLEFLSLKEAAVARRSLHMSTCHIVGNPMHWIMCRHDVLSVFISVYHILMWYCDEERTCMHALFANINWKSYKKFRPRSGLTKWSGPDKLDKLVRPDRISPDKISGLIWIQTVLQFDRCLKFLI